MKLPADASHGESSSEMVQPHGWVPAVCIEQFRAQQAAGLDDIDMSLIDPDAPLPRQKVIDALHGGDPLGPIMVLFNFQRAEREPTREPVEVQMGWHLTLETSLGYIGLHSSWLGKGIYLGYPVGCEQMVTDELIKETLDVEDAQEVDAVKWRRKGADGDEVLDMEKRKWGEFWGPQLTGGGRMWINHDDYDSYARGFRVTDDNGKILTVPYGWHSHAVSTYPYSFFSEDDPEGPNAEIDTVQAYRDKFVLLAARLAEKMGGAQKIHVDYGWALMPGDLENEGFSMVERTDDRHQGVKGGETITLLRGRGIEPWTTVRSIDVPQGITSAQELSGFILDHALYLHVEPIDAASHVPQALDHADAASGVKGSGVFAV